MAVIEVEHLTKRYGQARGVTDVSFQIAEGEIFGFIGPNGAGKSTTIRTLLGLLKPTSGTAKLFGMDIQEHGPKIMENVGYLPSEVFYYDNMRVLDLLKYSASFYKKDCTKRMMELVDILELDVKKKIEDLSLGNKKKVGIVQGLLHEPKLIVLDEPTSGLDPLMQQKFFQLLKEENERGATILFSSHILSEVQKLCHRVAIIKDGSLVKVESMREFHTNNYKKILLELKASVPADYFALAGVTELHLDGSHVTFLFKGQVNELIQKLANLDLKNIQIEEPTLEEIFIHYYEKE